MTNRPGCARLAWTVGLALWASCSAAAPSDYISIDPEALNVFCPVGGSGTVAVTSNVAWTATSSDSAVAMITSGSSGDGNGSFTYNVPANTSALALMATINVRGSGRMQTLTVTVPGALSPNGLSISPTSQQVGPQGQFGLTAAVTAPASLPWFAAGTPAVPWLVPVAAGGMGSGTFTYNALANTSGQTQSATITVFACGQTATLVVTELGPPSR